MTQPVIPAAGAPPAAPPTSAQNPPAPPAPAPAAPPAPPANPGDPAWLNGRIKQAKESASTEARASLLKELGFATPEEAKAAADAAKKAADANKTAEQRAIEAETARQAAESEAARHKAATTEYAARMIAGLTPEQVEAVKAVAGDDPAKQITTITAMQKTWSTQQTTTTTTTTPAPGTTTAPPPNAPNGVVPQPGNDRSQYEQLANQNPFAAARFGLTRPSVYDPK